MNRELDLDAKSVHEAIEAQLRREGLKSKPVKPLERPVLAEAHSAIYKMHRYYARRPHNVFAQLIEHYSNPGDLILDPFCGGGVTLVEGLKPRRRVIGIDINALATWVTRVEVEPVDFSLLEKMFGSWVESFTTDVAELFKAKCPKCRCYGVAEWFEWSNVVVCPACGKDIVLGRAKKKGPGQFECHSRSCRSPIVPSDCELRPDQMLNVMVSCSHCENRSLRSAYPDDKRRFSVLEKREKLLIKRKNLEIPKIRFPDMDRARDDNIFGKGVRYFSDLFTARQRLALGIAKKGLGVHNNSPNEVNALYHVFSATLRYCNKLVFQSTGWQGGNPIEWAGHNYWLPFVYNELNPVDPIRKRFKAIKAGKQLQAKNIGRYCRFAQTRKPYVELSDAATCWISTQSSHDIAVPDCSIHAIITDPPFGGNVQYGELSDFYLVWLKDYLGLKNLSEKDNEAIETRHQGFQGAKDREFYENMLFKIFKECRRILKPDGWMVMTFHNRDIGVWMSLHRAALRAGFRLPSESESANRGMVYQPPVQNYTQTIHQRAAGSMLGDFILSFKPTEAPIQLEAIKSQLSLQEENDLKNKAEEIIRYHGGADETTLMTGLVPYLSQSGLLARLARFDLRLLLQDHPFVFRKSDKKWYVADMVDESAPMKAINIIPAVQATQQLVYSHLMEHKQATLDELLVVIYSQLVNSYRPQMSTIAQVLSKYCRRVRPKGKKRDLYIWDPKKKTPADIQRILSTQLPLTLGQSVASDHNTIIAIIAQLVTSRGYVVHVGETEQRKSPLLSAMSVGLTGLELGLPPEIFRLIKEIDLIILKGSTMLAAVEVATSISTFNKAVNDRFRNLMAIAHNLNIALNVVVSPEDFPQAQAELYTPANKNAGLASKVKLFRVPDIDEKESIDKILGVDI